MRKRFGVKSVVPPGVVRIHIRKDEQLKWQIRNSKGMICQFSSARPCLGGGLMADYRVLKVMA